MKDAVSIEINSLRKYMCDSEDILLNEVKREGIATQGKEKKEI